MPPFDLDMAARLVLEQYGWSSLQLHALGNRGGFSGAALWRVKHSGSDLCLRAWPVDSETKISRQRLSRIHSLIKFARNNDLTFIPDVLQTQDGSSFVERADRLWDLSTWMPGAAANPTHVTKAQVEAAFIALARLHAAWTTAGSSHGPCPGTNRRLNGFHEWESRVRIALDSLHLARLQRSPGSAANDDPAKACAQRAWQLLEIHAGKIPIKLSPWTNRAVPLQPCLCDIWHDHVLFEGDFVTGLVDFGGVKMDQVAVDLARLLGSLVEDRAELRAAGLEAYRRIRPLSLEEEELVSVLDMTGALVGLMTWLKWLYVDDKPFENRLSATRRLQALVDRVERWH
jgi:Ser/Thr protein kinase RdoA (MazF antagonist)